jgi:hypothetical protein
MTPNMTHLPAIFTYHAGDWSVPQVSAAVMFACVAIALVSAVTHYFADRRAPIRTLASLIPGKLEFLQSGNGLASGAAVLDQAWRSGWLFISGLVMSR